MNRDDDKIRERAYELWQEAGAPEGDDLRFWHQAERELSESDGLDLSEQQTRDTTPVVQAGFAAH
jgi:hypothetical protein